ncbi:MAG: MotA/TolQ/ExbB proton channel family protein [Gammaproteobacteria bacterium]
MNSTPQPTMSFIDHLGSSDPMVSGVLYLLLILSLLTWFMIIYKGSELWRARRANDEYAKQFWDSADAVQFLKKSAASQPACPLAQLTKTGVEAVEHYQSHYTDPNDAAKHINNITDTLTRALRQAIQDQITHFEAGLGILATIGNTAPFVGLFGTVIGIMSALEGIAGSGSADLNVVAGPIGEALIATAAGIACAVPAVVAYNSFLRRMKVFSNTLDSFAYDLLSHLASERAVRALATHEEKK